MAPYLKLFVFVKGIGVSCFPVVIGRSETVGDLKEAILKEISNYLKDARGLILYKVELPDGKNLEQLALQAKKEELEAPSCELSEIFPTDLRKHTVNILVEAPNIGQPPLKKAGFVSPVPDKERLGSEVVGWLLELHGKIWNRKDRRQELFRTIKLTIADYEKLEAQMAKLRQEGKCSAGVDEIQSVKLAVLQSSNTSPDPGLGHLAHPTNLDDEKTDNDNDVDELRSLFPSTLEYLDLSSLRLHVPPPRMPLPLLVRQEYNTLSEVLGNLPKKGVGSAIISGQPGIGKTAYLYLRLVQSMIAGTRCLFQTEDDAVYLVAESVTRVDSWLSEPIVAFCDADGQSSQPPRFILENERIQIIAASPPGGADEKWTNKMPPTSFVKKFVTTLWSPQEFFLTGLFFHPKDLRYSHLQESTVYFGFNPRNCFAASSDPESLVHYQKHILRKVADIPPERDLWTVLNQTRSEESVSHSIFQLSPKDDMRRLDEAEVEAVSWWALNVLLNEYEARQAGACLRFYNWIVKTPEARTLRGQLFERQVLKYFGSLEKPEHFTIRCLADSANSQWTYPGPTKCTLLQPSTVVELLHDAVADNKPLLLVSGEPNFLAIDSILYIPGEVLAGIQITAQTKHPVAVVGLGRTEAWLRRNARLSDLRPSITDKRWRLIFVVPEDMASGFGEQPLQHDTGKQEWSKKVNQYVLGIREDELWSRETKY